MSEYEKVTVRCRLSDNSDYSDAKVDTRTQEVTSTAATKYKSGKFTIPTASALTVLAAGEWTTLSTLFIKNLDATNYVTVSYTDAAADAHVLDVLAGKAFLIQDVDPSVAVTLQADTSAVEALLYMSGA